MNKKSDKKAEKWILYGIPVLFAGGSVFHFIYELTGQSPIVGTFAPINESVWEHTKMSFIPTLAWWGGYWLKNRKKLHTRRWFTACAVSLAAAIAVMPVGFYFYTGAFGVQKLAVDILLLLIAVTLGQLLGKHVYKYSKEGLPFGASVGILLAIALLFVLWTFFPPDLPLFISKA